MIAERAAEALAELFDVPTLVMRPLKAARGFSIEPLAWRRMPRAGIAAFERTLGGTHHDVLLYDPARPPRDQRNVVHVMSLSDDRAAKASRAALVAMGLADHLQTRILCCDGPVLLSALGVYWPGDRAALPAEIEQLRLFAQYVQPALRLGRLLSGEAGDALDVALDATGTEGYLVDEHGRLLYATASAAARLDHEGVSLLLHIRDAIDGAPSEYSVHPWRSSGTTRASLVTRRALSALAQASASAAARAWSLTDRQTAVLRLLLDGLSNKEIAVTSGISVRTVEIHISAILEKANVSSRLELVTRILTGRVHTASP